MVKFGYKFSNLCGSVYQCGNVVYTPDGDSLLSAVGSRVTMFDLRKHSSITLPFEAKNDVKRMAITPNGRLLLVVDTDGNSLCVDLPHRVVLYRFNFKKCPDALEFSPNGDFFAITHGRIVQIWKTPGKQRVFMPFVLHKTFGGHHDNILSLFWSPDSKRLVTGSADLSLRVYIVPSLEATSMRALLHLDAEDGKPETRYKASTLAGHRERVLACFFTGNGAGIVSVAADGAVFEWAEESAGYQQQSDIDGGVKTTFWKLVKKSFIQPDHSKLVCATMGGNLLLAGFSHGVFGLYEMPGCTNVYTLSISQNKIDTVAINSTGDWVAFGAADLGQLLVWEWKSETYVLKQQGHYYDVNAVSYSPDGQLAVTGGDDSKLKVWNTTNGFCFVTFTDHTAPITAVEFACGETGSAVISASLDGTVRAFDLARYRNFRTLTPPNPCQFLSLAIDGGGEIVCAGAMEPFEIYTWSLRTGRLLDVLTGHNGPVCSLAFSPFTSTLVSSSWDKSIRVWDPYKSTTPAETFPHRSEVLSVAFRPDAKSVCGTTLDGTLTFWNIETGNSEGTIDVRRDLKVPSSVCYTADGACVLVAARESPHVCIYNVSQRVLLKRYSLSRKKDSKVQSKCVRFSPNGHAWAAATTRGLMVYSMDEQPFAPIALTEAVTPQRVRKMIEKKRYGQALLLSLHLNDVDIVRQALEAVPISKIVVVGNSMPPAFLQRLLECISQSLGTTKHLEYYLRWVVTLLNGNGSLLRAQTPQFLRTMRALQKAVLQHETDLQQMCDENQYMMSYGLTLAAKAKSVEDSKRATAD
jgi:periodic tryptophan protein 2